MPMSHEIRKPMIHFFHTAQADRLVLREVELGMEEEGIPWKLDQMQDGNALSLAWEAAKSSNLEVGVGADDKWIVLTTTSWSRISLYSASLPKPGLHRPGHWEPMRRGW